MLNIHFNTVCDKCGNIPITYMINSFGVPAKKYIQYFIGDYIDNSNKSYFHDCYELRCPRCNAGLSDYSLVIINGQFVDVVKTAEKRKRKLENFDNVEEGMVRNALYKEYCEKFLGVEYFVDYSIDNILGIKVGDKINLMKRDCIVLERYEVVDITDYSDHIQKIIGRRILYKVEFDGNIRFAMFILSSEIDRLVIYLYKNVIKKTDYFSYDFNYFILRDDDILLPLDLELFSRFAIEKCDPPEDLKRKMLNTVTTLSDKKIATLIYNEILPFGVRKQYLKMLMNLTNDLELKQQIRERIEYDDEAINIFIKNTEGFIYALVYYNDFSEDETIGYFKDSISANVYMKDWMKAERERYENDSQFEDMKTGFDENEVVYEIRKYQIIDNMTDIIKPRIVLSGFMDNKKSEIVKESEYRGDPVCTFLFNEKGRFLRYRSYETDLNKFTELESVLLDRFEYGFVILSQYLNGEIE